MRRFGALLLLTIALLAGCGVLTAIPLLLFSAAANRISLTVIGFIQYVSPTIALVLAVAFFGEQFTMAHGICFALIWLGIAAIGAEAGWKWAAAAVAYNTVLAWVVAWAVYRLFMWL